MLGRTAGLKELENKTSEEMGEQMTALSPSDKTDGGTIRFSGLPHSAFFPAARSLNKGLW